MSSATISTDHDSDTTVTATDEGTTTVHSGAPATLAGSAQVPITLHAGGEGVYVQSDRPLDGASFIAGLMLGALLYFIIQSAVRWHARREARSLARVASIGPAEDRMAAEVAALARRTATLETIVTDPAQRTAREIEALR